MKTSTRFVAGVLALTLCVGMAAGCSSSSDNTSTSDTASNSSTTTTTADSSDTSTTTTTGSADTSTATIQVDNVAQVTSVDEDGNINLTLYTPTDEDTLITDYSSLDVSDYEETSTLYTLTPDDSTPVYVASDGSLTEGTVDDIAAGDMVVVTASSDLSAAASDSEPAIYEVFVYPESADSSSSDTSE